MARIEIACPACAKLQVFTDLLPFRAECDACAADLHVCITCRFYDRYAENECREDSADPVAKKDRANLCEYWKPREPGARAAATSAADEAKRKLEALFKKK